MEAILFFQCPADRGLYRVQSLFPVFEIAVSQAVKPHLIFHKKAGQLIFLNSSHAKNPFRFVLNNRRSNTAISFLPFLR